MLGVPVQPRYRNYPCVDVPCLKTGCTTTKILLGLGGPGHVLALTQLRPCAQHFHFYVGPPVEQTDTPPAAGLENRNKGKIQLQHGSQEILCQTGLVDRVGAFRTSTTPTSTYQVCTPNTILLVLPLYNQQVRARHNIVGTKNGKILFWVIYLFFNQRSMNNMMWGAPMKLMWLGCMATEGQRKINR